MSANGRFFSCVAVVSCLFATAPLSAQYPLSTGWRGGGYVGLATLGGDFDLVSTGVGGGIEGVYISASRLGIAIGAHGSLHSTEVDGVTLGTLFLTVEPRIVPLVGERDGSPYLGIRAGLGTWTADVPNRATLENTTVNAYGWELGPTAGLTASVSQRWEVGLSVAYTWMGFGDAGTEAFTFSGTELNGRQLVVAFSLHHRGG